MAISERPMAVCHISWDDGEPNQLMPQRGQGCGITCEGDDERMLLIEDDVIYLTRGDDAEIEITITEE